LTLYSVIIALEVVLSEKQVKQTLAEQINLKLDMQDSQTTLNTSKKRRRTEMSQLTHEEEEKTQFNQGVREQLERISHNPMKRLKRQLDLLQVTSPIASNNLSHNSDRSENQQQ
jgi:biopolymer transport protein ExbB/TolQ